jgi:hypothetical protein
VVDDSDAIAQGLGLVHVVRDQYHRDPSLSHVINQSPGFPAGFRIESRGQLVQDRDLGLPTRASAIDSRCLWPPDRFLNIDPARASIPREVELFASSYSNPLDPHELLERQRVAPLRSTSREA